ncbi:alpha/beta-hydrolase [Daedalea quercina L-15889]|uniref:Alpha/beta-hydrolase n=1 Tax=Daedalea quercina L-15889 TaxID=1314783 RepID=A0A165UKW1_9APHY|nr:alpha/beta-hydrolase [Daedalea quercina L-15889]
MAALPPFLHPAKPDRTLQEPCMNAVFPHPRLGASAHSLWWPADIEQPRIILLFIPGNPGLVEFYTPFLTAIHEKCARNVAILAHGHLGHSATISHGGAYKDASSISLTAQVESAIEATEALHDNFPHARLVVAGHSMGCWISLQVLRVKPDIVSSLFLLFPTISHIMQTPNGQSLSWLFRSPFPRLISYMSVLTRLLPLAALGVLFPDWPLPQILVLRKLLHTPSAIYASLSLADQEMKTIRELDVALLQAHTHRLHMYFADQDMWVGEQKNVVLRAFDADPGTVKIVHGHPDIPHAFCINHGEELARQCFDWLQFGGQL